MTVLDDVGTNYTPDQLSGTLLDSLFDNSFETAPLTKESIENTWANLPSESQYAIQETVSEMPISHYQKAKLARELLYFTYLNDYYTAVQRSLGSTVLHTE